jgi:hypothetical protein
MDLPQRRLLTKSYSWSLMLCEGAESFLMDGGLLTVAAILCILGRLVSNLLKGITSYPTKMLCNGQLTDYSLIANGAAIPFTAHATSPTITMPRIKAMTTGSIPSFLDLILNFAESDTSSSLDSQDTWIAQMKAKRTGNMVMYGDDTWLKLLPQTFDRADGTSSFFVSVSQ